MYFDVYIAKLYCIAVLSAQCLLPTASHYEYPIHGSVETLI